MELIERLLFGSDSLWGGGVAHSVMILALVIALGIMLGKIRIAGVSLGVTGILFVGIAFSCFGMNIDEHLMHFLKEFGLILFVYSIGLQVGPGFFSSFRKGGVTLNKLAALVVALGVVTTVVFYYLTGLPITAVVGVMSGAVTNTPGLGAAQQAFSDLHAGADAPDIATGYALAYPLGVIGAILTLLALRYLLRIDVWQEEEAAGLGTDVLKDLTTRRICLDRLRRRDHGRAAAAGGHFRTLSLQTQLLYADRRAFGRLDQSAGAGLFDRTDHLRRPFGGICHGLPVVDVPAGAGGPTFDTDFRINPKRRGEQRPVTAITSHCIEISSRRAFFSIEWL